MAKIVVMGAGIGGISQVYELKKEFGNKHQIVLVGATRLKESAK